MTAYLLCYLRMGSPLVLRMGANNNKEVNRLKKADNPVVIRITGNNNKVIVGESKSHLSAAITIALGIVIAATVLAVSLCCPEMLADFVRLVISTALRS